MSESPRWLYAGKRYDEANKIMATMAQGNGREFPENAHEKLEIEEVSIILTQLFHVVMVD